MEPNAVQDILEGARFEGMIETIRPVTDMVDIAFSTVITFVAFFIISVALLRNVLAGAYCAFPLFWDHVHEAHDAKKDTKFYDVVTGLKDSYKEVSMSSIKTLFMTMLPDIKCLTDFKDDTVNPKAYFVRAIPQMILVVIIGVFIYNGYYRDATSIVANTGSEIIERTVLSFDPMGAFDTLMNTAGRPTFATDNAVTALDKNKNKITSEIYSQIISKYTDIKDANSKADLASEIDSAVDAILGTNNAEIPELTKYFSAEDGSWSITTRVEIVKDFNPNNYTNTNDTDKKQFCWKLGLGREDNLSNGAMPAGYTSVVGDLNIMFDSTTDAAKSEKWYIRVMAKATRNVISTSTKDVHITIKVPVAGAEFKLTSGSSARGIIGQYGKAVIKSIDNGFKIEGVEASGNYQVNQKFTLVGNDLKGVNVTIDNIVVDTAVDIIMNDSYVRYYDVSYDGSNLTAKKLDTPKGSKTNEDGGTDTPGTPSAAFTITVGKHTADTTYTLNGITGAAGLTGCAGITVSESTLSVPSTESILESKTGSFTATLTDGSKITITVNYDPDSSGITISPSDGYGVDDSNSASNTYGLSKS